ncbi:unnamed protein product [Leuciscus chuanchicus]
MGESSSSSMMGSPPLKFNSSKVNEMSSSRLESIMQSDCLPYVINALGTFAASSVKPRNGEALIFFSQCAPGVSQKEACALGGVGMLLAGVAVQCQITEDYSVSLTSNFKETGRVERASSALQVTVEASADFDNTRLFEFLPTCLGGTAFSFWDSLPSDIKQDYNQVFAAEICHLVDEAFPTYEANAWNGEQFRRFVAGIEPYLQLCIHEQGVDTLHAALMLALQIEQAQQASKTVPTSSCSTVSTAVHSATSGDFMKLQQTLEISFMWPSAPGKLPVVDNEGQLPTATDTRPIGNVVEHHVTSDTEAIISAKLASHQAGLQPNRYTGVFEPHYLDHSKAATGGPRNAWQAARGRQLVDARTEF